jgi:hypothetical protein
VVSVDTLGSAPTCGSTLESPINFVPLFPTYVIPLTPMTPMAISKPKTKVREFVNSTRCMVAMIKILKFLYEARDTLLATRFRINNSNATSMEISNLKQVVEMGVLSEENGK